MREYQTPLSERIRQSRLHARKMADPDYRLRNVNKWRVWKGLEPYTSVDQIMDRQTIGRLSAARQQRCERGRYA